MRVPLVPSLLLASMTWITPGCGGKIQSPNARFREMAQVDTTGMTEAEAAEAERKAQARARLAKRIYEDRRRGRYHGQKGGSRR